MYNLNCLSGIRRKTRISLTPQIPVAVLSDGKLTFDSRHSFAVALAKSQDHQSYLRGFFVWRLCNAVRQWLHLGIPCYTSELKQGRWAKDRAEWFGRKSNKSVLCDAMTWLRREVIHKQSECCFSTVRLCFAQTITKGKLNARLIR